VEHHCWRERGLTIQARKDHFSLARSLILCLVRAMNIRIVIAILLATSPFATALANTKVVLPHSQRFADTGRDFLLETTIPGDFKTLEGIVWGLLTLSSQCPNKQFSSYFLPDGISSSSQAEGAQPLYMYFRGLRRDGKKVVLRFTADANRYLNNTAAIQELVKGPLEATIRLHTSKSTTVYYEIDGEIVEEWDA
jgi:hypothetical protein